MSRLPILSEVPAEGMVSSFSSNKPFSVFGPSVGSSQPMERLSTRMVAEALTM